MDHKVNNKKRVIIVGMHRSGTTMLAKLLSLNGIHMGILCDQNFESRIYAWDLQNYLNFLGGTWDNPWSMNRNFESDNFMIVRKRFISQLEMRFRLHAAFRPFSQLGFKHPVASLLLPEVRELTNSVIIAIKREKNDIVKSLQRRRTNPKPSLFPGRFSGGQNLYQRSVSESLNDFYSEALSKNANLIDLNLSYEKLVDESLRESEIEKLANFLSREITYRPNFFTGKS